MPEKTNKSNTGLIAGIAAGVVAVIAIVVVVIIIIANSTPNIVGTWKLDSMTEAGETWDSKKLEEYDIKSTMEFKSDGTCVNKQDETVAKDCTYDKDKKTIKGGNDTYSYEFKDGKLVIKISDDATSTYVKQ